MTDKTQFFFDMEKHLITDSAPSAYFNGIIFLPLFSEYPFNMLRQLRKTKQSPKYHPEGSVWNHTMLVIDCAAGVKGKSGDARVFMWAALLHDIGKPQTTRNRNGKITSYGHEKLGADMAERFLREFDSDMKFIGKVSALVKWHMQVLFVANGMPFADVSAMKRQSDVNEVALLGFCDRMGRLNPDRELEEKNIDLFLEKCR